MAIELVIPRATPTLNAWMRLTRNHAAKSRHMRDWAWAVRAAMNGIERPGKPLERCTVHVVRETHSALSKMDWDGLYGGLKPLLDCLVVCTSRNPHGLGVIVDDNMACIRRLTAEWRFRPKAEGGRTLVVIGEES